MEDRDSEASTTLMAPPRDSYRVLGTRVDATDPQQAADQILEMVSRREKSSVVFCTVGSVLSALDDPEVDAALRDARLVAPDGMPLVWLGRGRGLRVERVYGPDFMLHLMSTPAGRALRHFFYGGAPGVADELTARLRARWPDLQIAGTHAPGVVDGRTASELDASIINAARPDVVWVGLGHPKQELWMKSNRDLLDAPVLAGVGAAFDFLSGRKREAPEWMKRSGLQWLHRLLAEPHRLWRRYLIGNARFVYLLGRERVRRTAKSVT